MRAAWLLATLAFLSLPTVASAGEGDARPPPSKEDQASAAKKFKEGEKAYDAHEYAAAAASFEEAYTLAPHPDALLNAIDARRKAGELRVAAQHCQRLIAEFPDAKQASDAKKRLADLTPKLGRIELVAKGDAKQIFIDQFPAVPGEVFVDPGDHVIVATFDGKEVEKRVSVVAGARATVLLEPAPTQAAAEGGGAKEGPTGPRQGPQGPVTVGTEDKQPIPIPVFFTGLGLTLVFGSVLVWSGMDTNSALNDFETNPTQKGYDEGLSKEVRTNVFIGLTAAFGAATGVVAIFTEWSIDDEAKAAFVVGPGSFGIEGSF
jgi:hypothetical protein